MNKPIPKERLICWNCKKKLLANDECVPFVLPEGLFFLCRKCHEIDPVLRNYKETEIFSRCVGYIRPVKNWNPGKAQEFKDRVTYEI